LCCPEIVLFAEYSQSAITCFFADEKYHYYFSPPQAGKNQATSSNAAATCALS
jgi:hypothetical protein